MYAEKCGREEGIRLVHEEGSSQEAHGERDSFHIAMASVFIPTPSLSANTLKVTLYGIQHSS